MVRLIFGLGPTFIQILRVHLRGQTNCNQSRFNVIRKGGHIDMRPQIGFDIQIVLWLFILNTTVWPSPLSTTLMHSLGQQMTYEPVVNGFLKMNLAVFFRLRAQ